MCPDGGKSTEIPLTRERTESSMTSCMHGIINEKYGAEWNAWIHGCTKLVEAKPDLVVVEKYEVRNT